MDPTALTSAGVGNLLRQLDRAPPTGLVEVCGRWLRRRLGATSTLLLLADYGEVSLEPIVDGVSSDVPHQADGRRDVRTSSAGVAYREQRRVVEQVSPAPAARVTHQLVHLPVSIRTERLGVLRVEVPGQGLDADVAEVLEDAAQVLA
ncbi:MAG TPA: hypothetical protein VFF37_16640 [Streptomyces sp.]|nr:hypothetical protein [Streptomyces sp.]